MISCRVRRLRLEDSRDALEELRRRGFGEEASRLIAFRARSEVLWIEGLDEVSTRSLTARFEESGGEAFQAPGGVLLVGPPAALAVLVAWAAEQGETLRDLGRELAEVAGTEERPARLLGRGCSLVLDRPRIMGILNVTPDSFSDGGSFINLDSARRRAEQMAEEGADLIDVGGESTRPGAAPVVAEIELERVLPVVEALCRDLDLPLSVDTTKSSVARAAVQAGAGFINDISGLRFDPGMAATAAATGAGLFLMHTRGRPDTMQTDTSYRDLVGEVISYLREGVGLAREAGVPAERLAIDPGIGFGKSMAGNLLLLRRLPELSCLGLPVLLGTSRKGFIGRVLQQSDPRQRLPGTLATVALGVAGGAQVFRVHDVGPAREAALMAWAVARAEPEIHQDD